ncbi:PAR1 [Artemisia annua]|uniref:PAR1 n=1 Tax=Artemisia annua TaxID=35608 RepID=A0A2U1P9T7_ARTAN|nr:PAR1 [Artemisia annua]
MDSSNLFKIFLVFTVVSAFSIQATLGSIACENLNKDSCAFAVSSSGKRCVLEKGVRRSGEEVFVCSTSQIDTDKLTNWIETDECLEACGLNRNVLGISSDSLLETKFTQKLCTTQCYNGCPNIVDLYFNLAAGEGVYLPSLCQTQGDNKRRGMSEIRSSGFVAPGPVVPVKLMTDGSPIMAPSPAGFVAPGPVVPVKLMTDGSPFMAPSPAGSY